LQPRPEGKAINSVLSALASAGSSFGAATSAAIAGAAASNKDESPIRERRAMARRDIQDLQSATLKLGKAANRLATLANASSAHNAI
jgi:hypothetical protein